MNNFNKQLFDVYLDKLRKEAISNQTALRYAEQKAKQETIYNKITKDTKFVSKFVKKCQCRQSGEKTVFYDIDIEKMPSINFYGEFIQLANKYDKLQGRSVNLSMYASIKREILINDSVRTYIIPAVERAYDKYVHENFYGKEIDFEGEKVKAFQIDWFHEIYISNERFETTFQKKIKDIKEKYNNKNLYDCLKEYEPESWERAWIDYVERYDIHDYLFNCQNMIDHPENYSGIKNIKEYIKEAEKITHRKFHIKNIK